MTEKQMREAIRSLIDKGNRLYERIAELESENEKIKKENQHISNSEVDQIKEQIFHALENNAIAILKVDYTRENYNKLFPRGEIETPNGKVLMGKGQFERLEKKNRTELLGAMFQTLKDPIAVVNDFRIKDRHDMIYIKSFWDEQKKIYTIAVVDVDKEGKAISYSYGYRKKFRIHRIIDGIKTKDDIKYVINEKTIKKASSLHHVTLEGGSPNTGTSEGLLPSGSTLHKKEVYPSHEFNITPKDEFVNHEKEKKEVFEEKILKKPKETELLAKTQTKDTEKQRPKRDFGLGD